MNLTHTTSQTSEIRTIQPYGPDVVYAPPAFKGQKSAKGATQARFAMIAARLGLAVSK